MFRTLASNCSAAKFWCYTYLWSQKRHFVFAIRVKTEPCGTFMDFNFNTHLPLSSFKSKNALEKHYEI